MPSVVEQILRTGTDLLTKGTGAKDSLAALLQQPLTGRLISLKLDTYDGPLLSLGSRLITAHYADQKTALQSSPVNDIKNEKRFLFSMKQSQWDVLTALNAGPFTWFTLLSLDITSAASTPLKSVIFKIADHFATQSRSILFTFLSDISALCSLSGSTFVKTAPEQELLDKITDFSPEIQSVLLLHENGTLLFSSGPVSPPEELAHSLIQFHHRSNNHLSQGTPSPFSTITLSDNEYTVEIGKIRDTNIFIVVSASGENALATARFVARIGLDAFYERLKSTGTLAGSKRTPARNSLRVQDSWFSPPRIIPQGSFAGIIGTTYFHETQCRALVKVNDDQLIWFQNRSEPLQHRLQPCPVCDP